MLKVGLCGFTMSAREYVEEFAVVEVQQTFYHPPPRSTVRRWRDQAPAGFEFTMKAWQLITHRSSSNTYRRMRSPLAAEERDQVGGFQWTPAVLRGWESTVDCARILRATAILFQCPASFRPEEPNLANMRAFFTGIDRPAGVRMLWEPRGPWPDEIVTALCRDLDLVHVVDPFVNPTVSTELIYYRLHGLGNHYRSYTDDELRTVAKGLPAGVDSYVMFNNIPRIGDARRFLKVAGAVGAGNG